MFPGIRYGNGTPLPVDAHTCLALKGDRIKVQRADVFACVLVCPKLEMPRWPDSIVMFVRLKLSGSGELDSRCNRRHVAASQSINSGCAALAEVYPGLTGGTRLQEATLRPLALC